MKRLIAGAIAGAVSGTAATWFYLASPEPTVIREAPTIVRDIRDVPSMSSDEAESHREQRFASLTTIKEMLRLPSDFDQTEALYVIAGRSDSAAVQDLIDQANRIADLSDRRAALSILFSRLTDIDPESAVAIAGHAFAGDQSVEASVWRSWARHDLDGALEAARKLVPESRKVAAAQSIYGAYGFLGNDITEYIEQVLGVPPSRWIRTQYIQSLAAESPSKAIEYINELRPLREQANAARNLGAYLGRTKSLQAEAYSRLFVNSQSRSQYDYAMFETLAIIDPALVLDRWLSNPKLQQYAGSMASALSQLTATDPDRAIEFFNSLENPQFRQIAASSIVNTLARDDPKQALAWARENDRSSGQSTYQQAILLVAEIDADAAMEAINDFPNASQRDSLTASVISSMVRSDPALAVATLEQITEGRGKQQAARQLVMSWVQEDPQAAMTWALESTDQYGTQILQDASSMFIMQDPEAAMRLLPGLDQQTASDWSIRIVQALADKRSPAEAEAFMQQYKNTSAYPRMQAILIPRVAQTDVAKAKQMVDAMVPGDDRDRVYTQLIAQSASRDPQQAIAWLDSITNDQNRASAISSLVSNWGAMDPSGAYRWVTNLPASTSRDQAIMSLVGNSQDFGESQMALINSISNEEMRSQARVYHVTRIARFDRQRAINMIENLEFDAAERARVEQFLNRDGFGVVYD
jgi:hypothetical protein